MNKLECVKTNLGNDIELFSVSDKAGVLIIGCFHGDEPQGKYLIDKYLSNGDVNPNLMFIPCLNPDGVLKKTRTNSNGVDLNRNFPTKNWGKNEGANATCNDSSTAYYGGETPASEIETRFVIDIIEKYNPSLIVTLHAPYKIVNYDGPAKIIAEKISNIVGYPVESSVGYPTPGSFGTYCGVERNIPTITLELDEECPVQALESKVFKMFRSFI